MFVLISFAFFAGIVTILSPCILPVLPIILSSSATQSKKQPFGVVIGFIVSFTFFTLFLSAIVQATGLSADALRIFSVIVIVLFGLVLVIPRLQMGYEIFASKLSAKAGSANKNKQSGFFGGLLIGVSLGLIWTPCVGPILASVISLAITGSVSGQAVIITLAYSLGTAIPMLLIMYGGRGLINRVPWLLNHLGKIQKFFGFVMILIGIAILFNLDRQFQSYILEKFPSYGTGLTKFEESDLVQNKLKNMNQQKTLSNMESAPEIIPGGEWFNSEPLTLEKLKGKVVIIDFWTYSCINCIRTLPYINDWNKKYADKGLVIIGVHSPEFEFEKNPKNLEKAIADFGIEYPVVQDNNFDTWRAYNNRYWPAKYFIDKDGMIRDTHFGEGDYAESEKLIKELLAETGAKLSDSGEAIPEYQIHSQTPETYLGYLRLERFSSPEKIEKDTTVLYSSPKEIEDNNFAYEGNWNISEEHSSPSTNASLSLNFEAKKVFIVMRPKTGTTGKVKVYLDGQQAGEELIVDSDRLYELINLDEPGRHIIKMEFLDNNTQVFAFTFG